MSRMIKEVGRWRGRRRGVVLIFLLDAVGLVGAVWEPIRRLVRGKNEAGSIPISKPHGKGMYAK